MKTNSGGSRTIYKEACDGAQQGSCFRNEGFYLWPRLPVENWLRKFWKAV